MQRRSYSASEKLTILIEIERGEIRKKQYEICIW